MEKELFYKVFNNIFLKSKIQSFHKNNCGIGVYGWEELNSSEWLIENGYLNVLKEKIKRKEHLSFYCNGDKKSRLLTNTK
ncbi:hypothetical protein ACTA71_008829 [Dictyostelium dimigraforme]